MSPTKPYRLYEQIHAQRASMSPGHERIARFLLDHPLDTALLTATQLAQQVNVDPATVVRFAQKLGYEGYLELKAELVRIVRQAETTGAAPSGSIGQAMEDAFRSLSSSQESLWESIDKPGLIPLVELLGLPSRLLFVSDEHCKNTVMWLAGELRDQGFSVDTPSDDPAALGESILSSADYDRALIFEGPSPSPALEHVAQAFERKGIRSLAILGSGASQIRHYVDTAVQIQITNNLESFPLLLQHLLGTLLLAVSQLQGTYRLQEAEDEAHGQELNLQDNDP